MVMCIRLPVLISALFNLEQALSDSIINQAPDLVASIREQLSVAYAAIDDKPQSDFNRNIYLDMQETTRQDRQLEARASQFEKTEGQLNLMLAAVIGAILLLLFSLWLFNHMNRKHNHEDVSDDLFEQKKELFWQPVSCGWRIAKEGIWNKGRRYRWLIPLHPL